MNIKKFFIIFIVSVIAIVLLQNTHLVTLSFLFWHVSMSQIILIVLLLLIGFIVGYIVGKDAW